MAKRRLTDLYIVGKELLFDDGGVDDEGNPDPIKVFIRKLNPIDHSTALKRANAARSRSVAAAKNPESDAYVEQKCVVEEFDRDQLISYLVEDEKVARMEAIEAECADEEEWSKDGYLDGLKESWYAGLKDRYAIDPTDEEALQVFSEMKRFEKVLDAAIDALVTDKQADLEARSDTWLQVKVLEKLMDMRQSLAWLTEYRACEIWLATKCEDRKTPYFESREEVDLLPAEVQGTLMAAYRALSTDPVEGKGSRATATSSPSSEQPDVPAVA